MKQLLILFFIAVSFSLNSVANTLPSVSILCDTASPKKQLVKVTNWGSRAIYLLSSSYFDETKDEIIAQLGVEKFEDMQNKCSSSGWPAAMYDSEGEAEAVEAKMNKLTMYQIGVYQHKYNGNIFDKYSIIEVPYSDNAEWDINAKWEGSIYFLINVADVTVIQ